MNRRDVSEQEQAAALEAYRAAAHAEADAHFDDRALDTQRNKILARLAHLGQTAKVIRFPLSAHVEAPASGINRRWITLAAAAGLIIGLLGGQLVRLLPQSPRQAPSAGSPATSLSPTATGGATAGSTRALFAFPQDDGLLDEVDFAVQVRSASELRALDELTPLHDPR